MGRLGQLLGLGVEPNLNLILKKEKKLALQSYMWNTTTDIKRINEVSIFLKHKNKMCLPTKKEWQKKEQ